jgi:hypothetical protein
MKGPKSVLAIAALAIAALTVAACGSSSKSTSKTPATSKPAITKAQFVKRANAICKAGNKTTRAAGSKLGKNPSKAQFTAFVKKTNVPSIQAQINAVRALGAPPADAATVKKFLALAQADLDRVKKKPGLLGGKRDPFADFAKVAHPYGLKSCDRAS